MSTNEDRVLRTMRAMAWDRAKGELRSMLQTYWGDMDKFTALNDEVEAFILSIEENGTQE